MADNATTDWASLIPGLEKRFGLPLGLMEAVIQTESSGNPKAKGKAGERGLMQFMPATAKMYGVTPDQLEDPRVALTVGAAHLSKLLKTHGGDVSKAVQAYNPGDRGYIGKVFGHWGDAPSFMGEAPSKKATAADDETAPPLLMRKTTAMEGEDIVPPKDEPAAKKEAPPPDLTIPIMGSGTTPPPLTALAGPVGVPPASGPTLEIPPAGVPPAPPGTAAGPSLSIPPIAGAVPPAAPPMAGAAPAAVPAPSPQMGQGSAPEPPTPPSLVSRAASALGPASAEASEGPVTVKKKIMVDGKVWGYRLNDDSIARKVIKDASGKTIGYRLADKSIKYLGGPTDPAGAEVGSDIPRRISEGAQEVNRMAGFGLGQAAGELIAPEAPGAGSVGAGIGATTADVLNAFTNHLMYGTPLNISPKTLAEDAGINALADRLGMSITGLLGKAGISAGEYMSGRSAVKAGAKEAESAAGQVAKKAEAQQGAANLEASTKARQALAQKVAQAERGQGAANLKAVTDADLAHQTELSKEAYANAQAQGTIDANKAADKMRETLKDKYQPEARQAIVQQSLGRTPEETQAALNAPAEMTPEGVSVPGGGFVQRRVRFFDAIYSPIRKVAKAMGDKYEAIFKDHFNRIIETPQLGQAAADEQQYAIDNKISFSPKANKLLTRARELATAVNQPIDSMSDEDVVTAVYGSKEAARLRKVSPATLAGWARGAREILRQSAKGGGFGASLVPESEPSTVKQVLALRSDALDSLSDPDGPSRHAAYAVLDGADRALEASGVPGAKELAAQYRTYKTAMDQPFLKRIGGRLEPVDSMEDVVSSPQRFKLIYDNADPAQKAELKRGYADWVNRDGAKVVSPTRDRYALGRMFPNTPLADPGNWIHLDKTEAKIADVIASTPAVKQRYFADVTKEMERIRLNTVSNLRNDALAECGKLGPAGAQLRREIEGKTPEEAVAIATKAFSGMTPQEVVQQYLKSLKSPQAAGNEAAASMPAQEPMKSPEAAGREAISNMPKPPATATTGQPLAPATTPREAAINAIRSGKLGASPQGIDWVSKRAPFYVLALAAGAGSPYMKGMGIAALTIAIRNSLRDRLMTSLESEVAATAFMDAINNPATSGWKTVVNAGARAAIDDAASQAGRAGLSKIPGMDAYLEGKPTPPPPKPRHVPHNAHEPHLGAGT